MASSPAPTPDLTGIKGRQQQTWGAADYTQIGSMLVLMSEQLCEAVDLQAGQTVLDVAGGTGNASLAAARRFGEVTCTDYVPALLDRARQRAEAEGLPITIQEADAENLPFADASFDVVLSAIGAMFAPDQEQVAHELLRVCRPGGKIGMANWTPDGFVGDFFRTTGRHVPPPPGLKPVFRWGTEEGLRELFGDSVQELTIIPRQQNFRFRSPEHFVDHFRAYYGPTRKAFDALDAAGQEALTNDLVDLARRWNRAGDEAASWPGAYLEVVAVRA